MKSAAANIGAVDLSNEALALEMAAKNEDFDFISAHNGPFLEALDTLLKDIHGFIAAPPVSGDLPEGSFDTAPIKDELSRLKLALESMDARAMDKSMETLLGIKLDDNVSTAIQKISKNILLAEYDEAIRTTDFLLQKD